MNEEEQSAARGQTLPLDARVFVWQHANRMSETHNQFSLTRVALNTDGRAKSKFLSVSNEEPDL